MAINSSFKYLILTAMFLLGVSVLPAQTAGYYLDLSSEEPRFIQRLAWSGGMYSLHYEVIIEREEGGRYVNYLNEFITDNFIDISMPPGNYHFRVIAYDILDKPSEETQWTLFKVFDAIKPELYQPQKKIDYINDEQVLIFAFNGKNLEPEAHGYFVNLEGEHIVPAEIIINDDGSRISLVFDKDQLIDGKYEIFVINPGGLEASLDGIVFESFEKRLEQSFYLFGVLWMPIYPAYGDGFGNGWTFSNISARISINYYMFLDSYLGFEFTFSKCMDDIAYVPNGFTVAYNFLFFKWLPSHKAAFNFRAGIGFIMQPLDLSYSNMGVSYLFRVTQNLNIETGINYTHSFFGSVGGGFLPWIGLSILF